ncbi:hypothetical protein [Thiohalomonas denitrificans]|uniref:Uncharacterized protein n=1 Tax=Thiohalomonas denitrificans TaxID=415747 RepID=A0A1G5QSM6_9GAMM|nr:hypothetical protein [Thiohalomonas denitrificans]SCZ64676.1 hypothetical protein SAMN03097708_02689 [Thiohalomonas denitrificans]
MAEDLNKAEDRWRNRGLFRPKRSRRWGRLLFFGIVLLLLGLFLKEAGSEWLYEWLQTR